MFQSLTRRKIAEEQHICKKCTSFAGCNHKPDSTNWSFVLKECQNRKGE